MNSTDQMELMSNSANITEWEKSNWTIINDSRNDSQDDTDYNYRVTLKSVNDILSVTCLVLIMLSMGTDISFRQIYEHLRRPVSIGIGMFCQFVVMPLVGFTLISTFSLEPEYAISVLLLSCCPGGAMSNIFSYYIEGDVPLSVTMTCFSTMLALVFMPFNMWVYGIGIDVGELVIPYKSMATSLAYVTSPACVGMLIKCKFPKAASYVTKIGSLLGVTLIAVSITLQNVVYPGILFHAHKKLITIVLLMPATGLVLGYLLAWVVKRPSEARKTIAIECGIQNVAISIAVIALSKFSFELQGPMMLFPMLYAISMILMCFAICLLYQIYVKLIKKTKSKECSIGKEPNDKSTYATSNGIFIIDTPQ